MGKTAYRRAHIFYKSFLANFRNYMVLFSCFVLCVSVIFTFISAYQMSSVLQNVKIFNHTIGIGALVFNAAILMGVLTILLTVFAIRHYEMSRASDYAIFHTLGMSWKVTRKLKALEYVGGMTAALLIGMAFGNLFSFLFGICILHYFPEANLPKPDILTYICTVLVCSLIFIFCMAVTEEVFVETNFLNGAEAMERRPKRKRAKGFFVVGMILAVWNFIRYAKEGSEKISILFWFLAGVALIVYYGGSLLLEKMKEHEQSYFKHLLSRQRLFYQFWSNSVYIILFLGLWFMILFYYPVQILTSQTTMLTEEEYPYDYLWKMNSHDEKDKEFLKNLTEKYGAECDIIPMVMVTTPCMDQQAKMDIPKPYRQGQHIGISETSYEKMTGEKVTLKKNELLVVLQQGKDKPGHPLDFYESNSTYLHFGPAHLAVDFYHTAETFTNRYHVKEVRIKNLIGIYGSGTNENLVVFSDEDFEAASEIDNVTDLILYQTENEKKESEEFFFGEEAEIAGLRNRLVLIRVPEKEKEMVSKSFQEQYENGISEKLYDSRVGLYYDSEIAHDKMVSERILKNVTNLVLYGVFIFIVLFLSWIKVYTDQEEILKEDRFYRVFGLKEKERETIWFRRLKSTFFLPFGIALLLSMAFIITTWKTRLFHLQDVIWFARQYVWILLGACLLQVIICIVAKRYLRHKIRKETNR